MRAPPLRTSTLVTALLALSSVSVQAQTFDFESGFVAAPPAIVLTSGGVAATFTPLVAPMSVGGVSVVQGVGGGFPYATLLSGRRLLVDREGGLGDLLRIDFSAPLTSVTLNFAGNRTNYSLSTASGTAFATGTPIFDPAAPGVPGDFGSQGTLTFSGAAFSSLVLTALPGGAQYSPSASTMFNVDNLVIVTAAPEPGTWALLGTGLAGLGLVVRRRRVA